MEYFVMSYDKRIKHPISLDFRQKEWEEENPFLVFAEFEEEKGVPHYICGKNLFKHYFCVSDELKELFEMYTSKMQSKPFFITNEKKKQQLVYWNIRLPEEDVLESGSFLKYDQLKLQQEPKENPYLFQIAYEKQEYLVVSLHLAENILRKNFYGIQFFPIKSPERKVENGNVYSRL